ncbi:hypothetical protein [Clostridium sp.]|jgi:hypothetical protein|uniref:hypothetical protein n=1 Tax=Clostridium sp. TaxID=1506 RepID=UPI0025888DC1|nr:hypothetical protein [Clostridium sp.]MDF2503002.1 hypothetical protein [Clostridium sp.]
MQVTYEGEMIIMAGNHTNTSKNNVDVLLKDLGLKQYRNTTIFTKENKFILSPSVANIRN